MYQLNKDENDFGYPLGEEGRTMLEDMSHHHAPAMEWTLDLAGIQPDETVLEVGCGGGYALKKVAERMGIGQVFGVDYSGTSVLFAKEVNAWSVAEGKVTIVEASVSKLPFSDNTFDKVYSIESYFFWPDLEHDFKEILRVLKPGGKIFITGCVNWRDDLTEEEKERLSNKGMYNLSFSEFDRLLREVGYQKVQIHGKEGKEWICGEGMKAL